MTTFIPEFIPEATWQAIPPDIQEYIFDEGCILFRSGEEPEDAFWNVLRGHKALMGDLFSFFDVGNPPKGVQWMALTSKDETPNRLALSALFAGRFLATTAQGRKEFGRINDGPGLMKFLTAGKPKDSCPFCFTKIVEGDKTNFGSQAVHRRCKAKLMSLSETIWSIIEKELGKKRPDDMGDAAPAQQLPYPKFLEVFGN